MQPSTTTAKTDDLIDITYTSYSIYIDEGLLQWCEMNGPLLDHIQVMGFLMVLMASKINDAHHLELQLLLCHCPITAQKTVPII
jgi:hypothetical protein